MKALAAILATAVFAGGALAQEKKAEKAPERAQKIFLDNKRVRASESTWKPGEANKMEDRSYRITRVLKGGTMERTHADGKKEKLDWKTGDVKEYGPDKASTKNIGKTTVVIYTVSVK
jgi:hypothetical protein